MGTGAPWRSDSGFCRGQEQLKARVQCKEMQMPGLWGNTGHAQSYFGVSRISRRKILQEMKMERKYRSCLFRNTSVCSRVVLTKYKKVTCFWVKVGSSKQQSQYSP